MKLTRGRTRTNLRQLLLTGGAVAVAAGCALESAERTDPAVIGVATSERWAASPQARAGIDRDWVRQLGGARLQALVAEALDRQPDLLAAAARVEQARAQARMSDSAERPKFGIGLDAQRQRQNFVGLPFDDFAPPGDAGDAGDAGGAGDGGESVLSTQVNTFALHADFEWELDLWGRIRAGRRAALADFEAGSADWEAARASLAAEVARAWFAIGEAVAQRDLARESRTAFQRTEEVLTRRFAAGDDRGTSSAQIRLARSDAAAAEAELARRENQLEVARRQLEGLLGRYPAGAVGGADRLPEPPPAPPAGLPSELLLRRPDLVAAERRFAAAGQRREEARRAIFPTLRLTGSGGTGTDELAEILNSDYGVWRLAGGVVQPIWRGGEILGEVDRREAVRDEALSQLQKAVLTAFGEVENALAAERWLAAQQRALDAAARTADEADAAARRDFAEGNGDVLTILTAQRQRLQLRSQAIGLRRARLDNRINLHLALGGGFAG